MFDNAARTLLTIVLPAVGFVALAFSPAAVQAGAIATDNAEFVSTDNLQYSADLAIVAGDVTPRVVVEGAGSVSRLEVRSSESLETAAASVPPSIMVEYPSSLHRSGLARPASLDAVADEVPARIKVEYADSLTSNRLTKMDVLAEPTRLVVSPTTLKVDSGRSLKITATLSSFGGNPIPGKTILWSAAEGSFSPSSQDTDSRGRVTTTYTAHLLVTGTSTTLKASFAGDASYRASVGTSDLSLNQLPTATSLTVSPSAISVEAGGNVQLTALLKAGNTPLADRTIAWQCNCGSLKPLAAKTDSAGKVSARYYAPNATGRTETTVTVSFAAEEPYCAATAQSKGWIEPDKPVTRNNKRTAVPGIADVWVVPAMSGFLLVSIGAEHLLTRRYRR